MNKSRKKSDDSVQSVLKGILSRLDNIESKFDEVLFHLKGATIPKPITLRDAIMAHLGGDRTLIEEYVRRNERPAK
jgi:hypothetical protein